MKRGKIIPELSSNYSIVEFPDFSSKEMHICSEDILRVVYLRFSLN